MVKAYDLPIDYVLYDLSYINMIMYCAVLPTYRSKKDKEKAKGQKLKADDPRNKEKMARMIEKFK